MNHYVYETTNLINGKKYIGKRSCKCPIEEDKYMGSGVYLLRAIRKYGVDNFKKRIIKTFLTEEDAYFFEKEEISKVNADINDRYYNIAMGGKGGICGLNVSEETRKKLSIASKGRTCSEETRKKISNSHKNSKTLEIRIKNLSKLKFKKVICLNNLMVFDCVQDANEYMGFKKTYAGISRCCKGKMKSTGKINGERALWLHYEDYIKLSESEIKDKIAISEKVDRSSINNHMYGRTGEKHHNSKKVLRINDMKVFINAVQAYQEVGLSSPSKINACCRGERNSAGKINGEPAKWMYYDDYVKNKFPLK